MEEGETVSIPTRKEQRKQKLMEYLAMKGRMKLPNPRPYLRDDDCQVKKPVSSTSKIVKGKENKFPTDSFGSDGTNVKSSAAQSTKYPPKRALGVSDKLNVKGNTQTGQQKAEHPSSAGDPSAMAHRKTLPNTALNNPTNERPVPLTARVGIKVQNQNTSNSKPLQGSHVLSRGLKSVPTSKCTVAPVKLERRVGMSKINKPAVEPTDSVTKQKSERGAEKSGKPSKVTNQTSLEATRRPTSKVVRRQVTQAAAADLSRKTKTCKETQSKKGQTSANVPPPLTGMKRSGAPVMSQTVPQPARTISLTGRATTSKTPKVSVRAIPQTEVKKMTADQEERMRKLQEWREARGISYKRPPMPVKPQIRRSVAVHQPFWTTMKEEDEAHSLICAVDRSLADCIKLLGEGCPPDQVKEVLSRLPAVSRKFAKYWICQVRLMELEGNLDVLPIFEEAVRIVLEPVDELRTVVFEVLKKRMRSKKLNQMRKMKIKWGQLRALLKTSTTQ
ncbi:hypothetical protein INR49_018180 [Caranx melampygus]|nr:hypothetical protein INR49_018180 [Caranx melampygus]